ncbi:unnamed protein product, partial [Staurois parvus]
MRCPWYLFHRLFFEFGQGHRGPMIPYCPMSCQSAPEPSNNTVPLWSKCNVVVASCLSPTPVSAG